MSEETLKEITKWKQSRDIALKKLNELADQLDNVHYNTNIAKLSGNSLGIVGGTIAVVGLLSAPFTYGLSLGLTIGGTCAGVAGAATNLGSSLTEDIIAKKLCKEAEDLMKEDLKETEILTKIFASRELSRNLINKTGKIAANSLQKSAHVANILVKAEQAGGELANASKILLSSSNALRVLGIGASLIFITLDVIELIDTSFDVHDGSKSKYATKIRELIVKLENNKKEIEVEFDGEIDLTIDVQNKIESIDELKENEIKIIREGPAILM